MNPNRRHCPLRPLRRALLPRLAALLWVMSMSATAQPSLYVALGEREGIQRLMGDFVLRLRGDARIGSFFKDSNLQQLAAQLGDQVCQLSGGPCRLDAPSMRQVHQDMDITPADFNRLVERLQDALDAAGVPFATQNRLLALLAPMHREIVAD